MKSDLVPMDCSDIKTDKELMFVAECAKIGEVSVVTEDVISNLVNLWEKLLEVDEAGDFGNVDKCLESVLICTAKLIFNVQYSQPKKVSSSCKSNLKTAIENCGLKFSDSEKRKNICVGISSIVCNPWTSDEFKKAYGGLKANKTRLNIPNEDIDALWNTEGWIFLETRGDYFVRIGNLATGPLCTSLNILVQKGREFYESNNVLVKASEVYDPFKFSYSKYLKYLEVYTIMASQGYFDAQSITSWNSRTILEVINALEKQAHNQNGEQVFSRFKFWNCASEAAMYLAKVATWKTLKSEEDEMAHEYFTEWLRLEESSPKEKSSPLLEVLEKFDEITSTANVYRVANAAVEYFGKTEFITPKYVEIYVRAMSKDMNAIEAIKSTDVQSRNKDTMRLLERKLSRCYVQLARFFKEHPKTSKECLLTAFSLNPCAKLFECLFPNSEFKKEINSGKDEDEDFLSSELADISVVKFDVDTSAEEDLQLPAELEDDLETVIHNPRYKGLFRWNSKAELETLCHKLLIAEGLDGIENRKLEYVIVDYEKYKDLPSQYDPEDDGIEKGYRKGEWRTRKRYNSKLLNRTGILKKAARKVKDALRIKNNSDSSIEKVKGSRKKLAAAIGTVRKRGRPLKHKVDSSAVNTAYKTKQLAKFKSVRLGNELMCDQGQVREVHNYHLPKSPWFPGYAQKDYRLSYGELFIKHVRSYNLESKERLLGRNIEVENQLISSTPQTIPIPSVFHQYGGGDQSMDTRRSHQVSEAYQNPALSQNIELHNGAGNEDSRFYLPAGFTSSSYSNNQQSNSYASAVHGATTNNQSSLHNIDVGQSSQLNYRSVLAASEAEQYNLLMRVIVQIQDASKQKLTKKLVSQRCRQQYPLEVSSVEHKLNNKKDMSKPSYITNQKINSGANPQLNENKSRKSKVTQMESAVLVDTAMDSKFHVSQADVVNGILGLGLDVKSGSESTKSSSNDNGCETLAHPISTESCVNNATPLENITNEVVSVPIPEVVMPDCAFQIMGMSRYKKDGPVKSKTIKSEVPPIVQNTGKQMFDQPKLLTTKLESEVVSSDGKYLPCSNASERSATVSAFQLHSCETKLSSQPIHHPEENRRKIIIKKCYPGAKKGRLLVIKSTPPMDAYVTPISRGVSSTPVNVSSQRVCTMSLKTDIIISPVSNAAENSGEKEREEVHSSFQVPQNNPIFNQHPSDTVSKPEPEVLQRSAEQAKSILINSPNPDVGEKESFSSENNEHADEPDKLKTPLESLGGFKPFGLLENNSVCNEAAPVDTNSVVDRTCEKESNATGVQLPTDLTDVNPGKCSSSKNSVTVNLKLHQQPLLLLCSSRIANKEIKVGNPDYAKEKNNSGRSRESDKILSETTQSTSSESSELQASENPEIAAENQPIPDMVQISEIKPDITEKQVGDVQLKETSHEDNMNQSSSEKSYLITKNNCDKITPTPEQEIHVVSTVSDSDLSPLLEQATIVPTIPSAPLCSDTQLKEVMIIEDERDTEIEECLHDVISSVENQEILHNLISNQSDDSILIQKTERDMPESKDNTSIGCLDNKTSTVFINSTNECNVTSNTTCLPSSCEIPNETIALQTLNDAEIVNYQSNVSADNLPEEEPVNNLKCESPELKLIDIPVTSSLKAEIILPVLNEPASHNSEIIDSSSAEVGGLKTDELCLAKVESDSQINNCGITLESESNYPSDATTDVDDEPETTTIKNERSRSVTPVHEVEELYDKIQQKSRRKNKRSYEDEEDKIKIAPSVVKHFKQHGGSLRQIFHCVLRIEKLSDDLIPPSSRNLIPVKRSSRLKDRKLLTVKAIQTAYQSSTSKEEESSRSGSRESSPEIQIIQEFGIFSNSNANSPNSTNGVLSNKNEMKQERNMPQSSCKSADLFRGYKTRSSKKENNITQQNRDSADHSEHLVKSETLVEANNVAPKSRRTKARFKRKRRSTTSTNRSSRTNKIKKLKAANVKNNTCSETSDDYSGTSSDVEEDYSYSSSSRGEDTELQNATDETKLSECQNVNDVVYPHMQFAPSPEEVDVDACDPLSTDGYSVSELHHISPLNVEHIILDSETSSEPHDEGGDSRNIKISLFL
ncbi:unnamed protein product [Orchesella dallaii]|uniref:Uncharacterized protein n=1 Tax=Orchesella dallaii TaxID=48710 RepID=A0ABP1RXB0_9HEXA